MTDRCIDGRLMRHKPFPDDPDYEHDVGECPDCGGKGCTPRTTLADGTQIYPGHREINPATGQQKDYVVLAEEERAKGFVRPVRDSYVHEKCGVLTKMSRTIAETYARNPFFYSGTFCVHCRNHFPVGPKGEFVWVGTQEKVGT